MARAIATIQQQIIDSVRGDTTLYNPTNPDPTQRGLTSASQASYWLAWTYIVSVAINVFEQLLDIFQTQVESEIALAAPSTPQWTQAQILAFQYSATTPQVVQVNSNFSVGYQVVNPALQIINQCAIQTLSQGVYITKVAYNGAALSTVQLAALNAYLQIINPAGITTVVISSPADTVVLNADIYFNSQYNGNISTSVKTAISNYLANLPDPGTPGTSTTPGFNGIFQLASLQQAIMAVPGVTNVVLNDVTLHDSAGGNLQMVTANTEIVNSSTTYSGNAILNTGASSLNFRPA